MGGTTSISMFTRSCVLLSRILYICWEYDQLYPLIDKKQCLPGLQEQVAINTVCMNPSFNSASILYQCLEHKRVLVLHTIECHLNYPGSNSNHVTQVEEVLLITSHQARCTGKQTCDLSALKQKRRPKMGKGPLVTPSRVIKQSKLTLKAQTCVDNRETPTCQSVTMAIPQCFLVCKYRPLKMQCQSFGTKHKHVQQI